MRRLAVRRWRRHWRVPGYDAPYISPPNQAVYGLGYSLAHRVDFLRKRHADPIDLGPDTPAWMIAANTSVPEFDVPRIDDALNRAWSVYRGEVRKRLLDRLFAAANAGHGPIQGIFVRQSQNPVMNAYGLWTSPELPIPVNDDLGEWGGVSHNGHDPSAPHDPSSILIRQISPDKAKNSEELAWTLDSMPPRWDGFVIDLSGMPGDDPLSDLVASLPK